MPAKKRTTKKSASKRVIRRVTARKLNLTGGITTRTWALFALFLLVSIFTLYRISNGY
ncbi:MAG: hypothetical protein NTY75_02980 [Candidatus Shapirobacteria bacterium]|nr:hypothetical protein [Candidatus Shapirobacteria bacterium]